MVRGAQSRRARAHDEDPLARVRTGTRELQPVLNPVVAEEPFDGVDANGFVHLGAIARGLTGMKTDAPHDRRERILLDELAPRGLVVTRLGFVEPALDVLTGRTSVVTRWQAVDVDRTLDAPGPRVIRPARADVERDGKGALVHTGTSKDAAWRATYSSSPSSPYRSILRLAIS